MPVARMQRTVCCAMRAKLSTGPEGIACTGSLTVQYKYLHVPLRSHHDRSKLIIRANGTKASGVVVPSESVATYTVRGTSRKQNEDRLSFDLSDEPATEGEVAAVLNVFDGHGGYATAEWLTENFTGILGKQWEEKQPEYAITSAFLEADRKLLTPKGLFGMGERGCGGSKCGSTVATVVICSDEENCSEKKIISANAGDARSILIKKDGSVEQLSEDHVPDNPDERKRIERNNPTPKVPLVRYVGGTWRIGGLLALSRALGDAYLKPSGLFEGIGGADDDYSSGFGLIALPHIQSRMITEDDLMLIVASDGLNSNPERGGGGGLSNDEVASVIMKDCDKLGLRDLAESLASKAVKAGSTDDVTLILVDLRKLFDTN